MVSASEFLKWLYVFKVPFGPNAITIPVSMAQGGTGAVLVPSEGSLFYSTDTAGALLATANDGVLVTGPTGLPSISTTLPSGLTIPDYLPLAGGTMTGDLFLSGMPLSDLQAATKEYVDDVAAGLAPTGPVQAATTAALVATYYNGPANDGKGATLTMNATGVVTLDGIDTVAGQEYMIKNQVDPAENGIYDCTVAGAIGVAGVFTRSTTFDTPIAINKAGITPILEGDTLEGQGWYEVNTITTIGVDPIVFIKFGNTGTVESITAGTGLTGGVITTSGTIALDIPVSVVNGGTGLTSTTVNQLLFSSANNVIAGVSVVNSAVLTSTAGGVPTWVAATGTGAPVLATSPTLVTPILGVATATSIQFNPTTGGIVGTQTNDNAGAGYVGQYVSASVAFASGVSLTNNTAANVTTLSLPSAGDWDATGDVAYNTSLASTAWAHCITSTSATLLDTAFCSYSQITAVGNGNAVGSGIRTTRFSVSGPTTIYLVAYCSFSTGTCTASGFISARRVR